MTITLDKYMIKYIQSFLLPNKEYYKKYYSNKIVWQLKNFFYLYMRDNTPMFRNIVKYSSANFKPIYFNDKCNKTIKVYDNFVREYKKMLLRRVSFVDIEKGRNMIGYSKQDYKPIFVSNKFFKTINNYNEMVKQYKMLNYGGRYCLQRNILVNVGVLNRAYRRINQ